ncbi:MAG TPA: hypothetical protein VJK51_03720 [Candidatus Nanoarchaeia archaeon]|nr:hypothetical protein [Candidatus Nanoarchaeia archaeon]
MIDREVNLIEIVDELISEEIKEIKGDIETVERDTKYIPSSGKYTQIEQRRMKIIRTVSKGYVEGLKKRINEIEEARNALVERVNSRKMGKGDYRALVSGWRELNYMRSYHEF